MNSNKSTIKSVTTHIAFVLCLTICASTITTNSVTPNYNLNTLNYNLNTLLSKSSSLAVEKIILSEANKETTDDEEKQFPYTFDTTMA